MIFTAERSGTPTTVPSSEVENLAGLVERANQGNRQAFDRLIDRFQMPIEVFVRSFLRQQQEVEDVTQEIFIAAYRHLSSLRDPSRFKSWLYRLAWNACMQFFRKRNIETQMLQAVSAQRVEPVSPPQPVSESLIPELLERLAPLDRLIVWLRYIDGVPFTEIGPILDMTETAARQRACRALGLLREAVS